MALKEGLINLADTFTKMGSVWFLENQRAETAKESMMLSNKLLGEREAAGRKESHEYGLIAKEKEQTFAAGESALERTSREKTAGMAAAASRYSADRGFEASKYSTDAGADARAAAAAASRAQTEASNLEIDQKKRINAATDEVLEAQKSGDAAAVAKAEQKLHTLNSTAGVHAAQVAANKAETKLKDFDLATKTQGEAARKELAEATAAGDQNRIEKAKREVAIYDDMAALRVAQTAQAKAQAEALQADANGKVALDNAKKDLLAAHQSGDQAQVKKAEETIRVLEFSSVQERQDIAAWQNQATLARTAMIATQTRLAGLGITVAADDPLRKQLENQLEAEKQSFNAARQVAEMKLRMSSGNAAAGAAPPPPPPPDPDRPPLNTIIKPPPARPGQSRSGRRPGPRSLIDTPIEPDQEGAR